MAALLLAASPLRCAKLDILPLDQIKPGMKGYARTVFAGDTSETMELEVVGVMPNLLGPRHHIILVELKGENVEFSGVAGGMSGSPVYIEGKLAGALSLRFGIFAKKPWAGSPIEDVLDAGSRNRSANSRRGAVGSACAELPHPSSLLEQAGLGTGAFLTPIETPWCFPASCRRH